MYIAFPSACMVVVRKDHKIKMRPPHTGCDGRDGGTLRSLFTSFPAVWAGAFRGDEADKHRKAKTAASRHRYGGS